MVTQVVVLAGDELCLIIIRVDHILADVVVLCARHSLRIGCLLDICVLEDDVSRLHDDRRLWHPGVQQRIRRSIIEFSSQLHSEKTCQIVIFRVETV